MKVAVLVLFVCILAGCQSGITPVTKRGIGGFNKPGNMYMHGKSPVAVKKPEIFVRKKQVTIRPKQVPNETGSLFKLDDQRNYLYASNAPFSVGQFVDVRILPIQSNKKSDKAPEAAKESVVDASGDPFVEEMLKSLPELDPGENRPDLIKNLKMQIAHVYDNGDALAVMKRSSIRGPEGNEISIRARIPYTSLISNAPISTRDLLNVEWVDSNNGQITERFSSGWQDEYSLRLSGFSEAKSIYAQQLEDKRQQLEGVKSNLQNQLISLGKERKKMAAERDEVLKQKAELDKKLAEKQKEIEDREQKIESLNSTVSEQKDLISEKDEEIKQLNEDLTPPEEKPGDERDGADGA